MKILTLPVFILSLLFMAGSPGHAQSGKVLIAYFSHTQTTEKIALEIQKHTGGDLFRIETIHSYPVAHRETLELAKKERNNGLRPPLKSRVENMDAYEVIFLGYPIWWYTFPMPLFTFLESYDLAGKRIIPFCTHGGSAMSGTEETIRKLQPKATVYEGLAVHRNILRDDPANGAKQPVAEWLAKLTINSAR